MAGRAVWIKDSSEHLDTFWEPLKKQLNDQLQEDIYRGWNQQSGVDLFLWEFFSLYVHALSQNNESCRWVWFGVENSKIVKTLYRHFHLIPYILLDYRDSFLVLKIYKDSIHCDWVIRCGARTLKLNRCFLISRSFRIYNILLDLFQEGSIPTKRQIDCLGRFLPKLYCETDIERAENVVLSELASLRIAKVTTPDSEGFITADSSPIDGNKHEFYDANEHLDVTQESPYLSKELEEQDHLSKLFHSISERSLTAKSRQPKGVNSRYVNSNKIPVLKLKRLSIKSSLSDMDSGLETASSETSGMDISDIQSPFSLEQLSNKERRIVNEHDSSSSDTTDDFEDLGKNAKTDLIVSQTKEQKQKQNEEIVIMESSSVSSETGSWESVFPRSSACSVFSGKPFSPLDNPNPVEVPLNLTVSDAKNIVSTSNGHGNHYFIDASSLLDESELCSSPVPVLPSTNEEVKPAVNKLTKIKVSDLPEGKKYDVAEFQKEIKVFENHYTNHHNFKSDMTEFGFNNCPSTSVAAGPSEVPVGNLIKVDDSSGTESSPEDVSKNLLVPQIYSKSLPEPIQPIDKYFVDICDSKSTEDAPVGGDDKSPNFVRSNTFEIETEDDDHITLLQQNERRQGSLIFQNSIQQYSTHSLLGMEDILPATPHNSIIQLSDSRIVDQQTSGDCPLVNLFDKPTNNLNSPPIGEEVDEENTDTEEEIDENFLDLKPIKREESVPIISGGVSSQDYKPEIRMDSPLTKRKLETTPIVSGGAVIMQVEPEMEVVEKSVKSAVTAAWVVDMKPEPEEVKIISASEVEISQVVKHSHKSSLGFYVDLNDIAPESEVKPQSSKTENTSTESGESDKKNIFSMFIDFEAPKKTMPSRLSHSLYSSKKPSTSKCDSQQLSHSTTNIEKEKAGNSINLDKEKHAKQMSHSVTTLDDQSGKSPDRKSETEENTKEKSVYMYIESDNTVVRRRRSSSNNRSSHNRHSWNSSGGDSDTSTLCHQRTYSLSGAEDVGQRPVIEENESLLPQDRKLIESSSSSDENKDTSSVTENEDNVKKMEVIQEKEPAATTSGGFVRLSDLDKPLPKVITTEPEPPIPTRMTRSIPETSWIENKLLMSRSTGCRTSSSRLYPHLSTSTPSHLYMTHNARNKSPGPDTDEMVSELSDLSSMHSSTALEVSTEETSHSSSYQPHHAADRLGHDLLRMFLEEISPDVTVEVGGRRLKAHKCILSSRCQYFAAMLSGGWVESAGNVISLQGFSYQAVHFAMCHIYSGAADIPETISLVELATLADMLGLEGLKEVVAYTLKLKHCHLFHKPCSVCVVGVLECLPLAAAYGLDDLYRKSLRWITRYFVRVWPTRAFAMLPRELMEKCYQQHVVHMSADNVLETTLCCDKLLVTLPSVRWAEIVHELTSQLADACQHYVTQHFSSVLASASFLSLGKELSWNISRLEDGLHRASERLPPEQACRSYARVHRLLALLETGDECWSPNFVELVRKLLIKVEDCVVRQAVRVSYTPAWPRLDEALRARIQELCCLPLDRPRVPRQPRSTSGSRNLDLRQVRLAMQQHSRRTQSTDSRPATTRPLRAPPKPVSEPPRPRTWPAQVNNKKIISSSESSRTSSPAMKRNANAKVNEANRTAAIKKDINNDMSADSLASPVHMKGRKTTSTSKPKVDVKASTDSLAPNNAEKKQVRSKIDTRIRSLAQPRKPTNNVLKSNVQKVEDDKSSKSLPGAMNKENRTLTKQQSKSGSSSSTQHSPSALLRHKPSANNSSSSGTNMSPYSGSPSLRRSLLLAARAPQTPIKPVSPATNKRLARLQASHSVTSPTKSSAAKCVNVATTTQNARNSLVANARKTSARPIKTVKKSEKVQKEKTMTVERSGTFLKDEPTVLNKSDNSK